jgi:hypothetical protein
MDTALISALSALGGSAIGGATSIVAALLSQRAQARAAWRGFDLTRRQDLYKDFMIAASKAFGEALASNQPRVQDLVDLYAMISRMRVVSSPQTVECADQVMRSVVDAFFAPNKTVREIHDMMQSGAGIDPLKQFSEIARKELHAMGLR